MFRKSIIFIFLLGVYLSVFSEGVSTIPPSEGIPPTSQCEAVNCELQSKIKLLEIELRNLKLEYKDAIQELKEDGEYVETVKDVVAERIEVANEKENAYNQALNSIQKLIIIFGTIITWIGLGFGIYRNGELKDAREDLQGYKNQYKESVDGYKELVEKYIQKVEDFKEKTVEELKRDASLKGEIKEKLTSQLDKIIFGKGNDEFIGGLLSDSAKLIIAEKLLTVDANKSIIKDIIRDIYVENGNSELNLVLDQLLNRLRNIEETLGMQDSNLNQNGTN